MKLLYILPLYITMMSLTAPDIFSQTPVKTEIVSINGTDIYYEAYGKGEPLFLLHGYTQSSKSWLRYVSDYANGFKVYLVDLKGHGRSGMFTEKLSITAAAADVDALIKYLQLDSIRAIGLSYGGDILFQLALMHPGLIKSMITIGSCGTWNINDFPSWREYLSYKNIDHLPWMHEQQTSEAQIRSILDQTGNYNISISDEELQRIQAKTLIVLGDQDDSIPLECISHAKNNLPHSFLWILPNTGHAAHEGKNKAEFVRFSKEFFAQDWINGHN